MESKIYYYRRINEFSRNHASHFCMKTHYLRYDGSNYDQLNKLTSYSHFKTTLVSYRGQPLAVGNWDPESDKNNRAELMDLESKVWSEVAHYSFQKG